MKQILFFSIILFSLLSCKPETSQLLEAIDNEDLNLVNTLIRKEVELVDFNNDIQPLDLVIDKKNSKILLTLIDADILDHFKRRHLHRIIENNWDDGIIILLDNGISVEYLTDNYHLLVDWSIRNKKDDLLRKLIIKGANINSDPGNDGTNSFFLALQYSNLEIISFLISNGADLTDRNKKGNSVLSYSILKNRIDLFDLFLGYDIDLKQLGINNLNLWEIIARYWRDNYLDYADALWENGLRFDFEYNTALHIAVKYHHYDYILWLLEKGINPDLLDKYGLKAEEYAFAMMKVIDADNFDAMNSDERKEKALWIWDIIDSYRNKKE